MSSALFPKAAVRRGGARLACLAACAAVALAGCTSSARPSSAARPGSIGRPEVSDTALPPAVPCTSRMLVVRAGREGESQGVNGNVEFTDVSTRPCFLSGVPRVAVLAEHGAPLPVRLTRAGNLQLIRTVLRPGTPDAADLVVFWANWCDSRHPGRQLVRPLQVRIKLAAGGVITAPFNGPPGYDAIPACVSAGRPSTISVVAAYIPTNG